MKIKISNGTVLTPFRAIKNGTVVVEEGKIIGVHEAFVHVP